MPTTATPQNHFGPSDNILDRFTAADGPVTAAAANYAAQACGVN